MSAIDLARVLIGIVGFAHDPTCISLLGHYASFGSDACIARPELFLSGDPEASLDRCGCYELLLNATGINHFTSLSLNRGSSFRF